MAAKRHTLHIGPYEVGIITHAEKNPRKLMIDVGPAHNRQVLAISELICEGLDDKYNVTDTEVTPKIEPGSKKIIVRIENDRLSLAEVMETVEATLGRLHESLNTEGKRRPNLTAAIKRTTEDILFGITDETPAHNDTLCLSACQLSQGILKRHIITAIPASLTSGAGHTVDELANAVARNLKRPLNRKEQKEREAGSTGEDIAARRIRSTLGQLGCEERLVEYLAGAIIDVLQQPHIRQSHGRSRSM